MVMPTRCSIFLNESLRKQQKSLPRCRYLKAEDICGAISSEIFLLVSTDIHLVVTNSTLCSDGALIYGALQVKVLVYTQYGQIICSLYPPWMGRPQYFDQNNQLISSIKFFLLLKWTHNFPFSVQQV